MFKKIFKVTELGHVNKFFFFLKSNSVLKEKNEKEKKVRKKRKQKWKKIDTRIN